ncbi:hypothetical protein C0Q70_03957 [Pomacea canaliculata]|uniref:Uncharacterized protein n=1 Tax=Pomacea canaliculata TaxID=400727 RepID=A0A2T7PU60_POMCA|nr:hypothetical protein C0Q70_03957 [Pomacea canaliculata]
MELTGCDSHLHGLLMRVSKIVLWWYFGNVGNSIFNFARLLSKIEPSLLLPLHTEREKEEEKVDETLLSASSGHEGARRDRSSGQEKTIEGENDQPHARHLVLGETDILLNQRTCVSTSLLVATTGQERLDGVDSRWKRQRK